MQQTLKNPLTVEGIGLHSGCKVKMTFLRRRQTMGLFSAGRTCPDVR